jgi:uncharacterized protein
MPPLTPTTLQNYIAHFRQRQMRDRLQQQHHYQHGWEQASIAADILKQRYSVETVFLFGSLLSPETVHPNSDIDLAVWGLSLEHYSDAVGTLLLAIKGISIDLVRLEAAQPNLKTAILQTGVEL